MSCDRDDDINRLIDGSLEPAARRDVEAHLHSCDECAAMADDLRRVRASPIAFEQLEPPSAAWDRVARRTVAPLPRAAPLDVSRAPCRGATGHGGVPHARRWPRLPLEPPVAARTRHADGGRGASDEQRVTGSVEAELRQAALHYENAIHGLEALAKERMTWIRRLRRRSRRTCS